MNIRLIFDGIVYVLVASATQGEDNIRHII
jgi:hypothetical protein